MIVYFLVAVLFACLQGILNSTSLLSQEQGPLLRLISTFKSHGTVKNDDFVWPLVYELFQGIGGVVCFILCVICIYRIKHKSNYKQFLIGTFVANFLFLATNFSLAAFDHFHFFSKNDKYVSYAALGVFGAASILLLVAMTDKTNSFRILLWVTWFLAFTLKSAASIMRAQPTHETAENIYSQIAPYVEMGLDIASAVTLFFSVFDNQKINF